MQNGITLIALVISIIVMMILAGVSISAIVGDDGVLSKAQYASFINEMAAVEEAIQMWKVNEEEMETTIPANGICESSIVKSTERLEGEIGFYRLWSKGPNIPDTDIKTPADDFNRSFTDQLIVFPSSDKELVEDLYYLNNDELGISKNKKYIIDASNGMIYSTSGVTVNGIRCYSLNMAKAMNSGNMEKPLFTFAEVSGSGASAGQVLAGNREPEFILKPDGTPETDEDGNPIQNPNYNPNAFRIMASASNTNIYKLYNNGKLYGKGIKGKTLNNSETELNELCDYKWAVFEIPSEIPGGDERIIVPGVDAMFIIDSNKELWAWGTNSYNRFGLSQKEQQEYTNVQPTKLNVNNKKVARVFSLQYNTFVITTDNELYVAGCNNNGQLGIGKVSSGEESFVKCNFNKPERIIDITNNSIYQNGICIATSYEEDVEEEGVIKTVKKSDIFYAGIANSTLYTNRHNGNVEIFTKIFDGTVGSKFDSEIKKLVSLENEKVLILDSLGKLFYFDPAKLTMSEKMLGGTSGGVECIYSCIRGCLAIKTIDATKHFYYIDYDISWGPHSLFDSDITEASEEFLELDSNITKNVDFSKIKDICMYNTEQLYLLMNDGKVYSKGSNKTFGEGLNQGQTPNEFRCIQDYTEDLPQIDSFCVENANQYGSEGAFVLLKGKDGKYYGIGNNTIMKRDKIFQASWKEVASNVKTFHADTMKNSLAYIDKQNDIWVIGDSASALGCNTDGVDYALNTFVRLKDKLEGLPIYDNISGKVEDYMFTRYALYIKTNKDDNNSLYVVGKIKSGTIDTNIGVTSDVYIPTKILENVEKYNLSLSEALMAITKEEITDAVTGEEEIVRKLYLWGRNNWSSLGQYGSAEPKDVTSTFADINLEKAYLFSNGQMSIVADEENLMLTGIISSSGTVVVNGVNKDLDRYTKFSIKEYLNTTEDLHFKNIVRNGVLGNNLYQVQDDSLYGLGNQSLLGLGTADTTYLKKAQKIETPEKFIEVVGGKDFYIGVTEDGKVYGTGLNVNGILGRWVGVGRGDSNSRYKTAFNWVECPDLEI